MVEKIILLMSLIAMTAGCSKRPAGVAEVNGKPITQGQWTNTLKANALLTGSSPNFSPRWTRYQVKTLADQIAVIHYSQKRHWLSSTKANQEAWANIRQALSRQHLTLTQALNRYHLTRSALLSCVAQQMWLIAAFNQGTKTVKPPSAAQLTGYYRTHLAEFMTPRTVLAREIIVKDLPQAQHILRQYTQGALFLALAQKYSLDSHSALSGGEMGWVSVPAHSASPTMQFLESHSPGQEGIVHMHLGYAIIDVQAEQGGKPLPLDHTTQAGIRTALWNQEKTHAFDQWSQPIIRQAHVRIF